VRFGSPRAKTGAAEGTLIILQKVIRDQFLEYAKNQLYGDRPKLIFGIKTPLETSELLTTLGSARWLQSANSVG